MKKGIVGDKMLFDVFISHASEDKDDFVRLLAQKLKEKHVEVWYDEFTLKPGDSIRRAIDYGLSKSIYGIVVFSRAFLKKEWTQWELDGLVQRLNSSKTNLIIPIWHNILYEDILEYSPSLADRMAIISSKGIDYVVSEILKIIKPEGSTLINARDVLIEYGFEPPVITDDWWLDVIEFLGSDFHMQLWGFLLNPGTKKEYSRGENIAWAAMQMLWQQKADYEEISQVTHPDRVLEFIYNSPGLTEMCHAYPEYLGAYVPQLTIVGFGGDFERDFEHLYNISLSKQKLSREKNDNLGSGLTINGIAPSCEKLVAFRHPSFGDYEPSHIAGYFVQGELMGLHPKVYDTIDYIIWFLSNESYWFPETIKKFMIQGLKDWNVWPWKEYEIINDNDIVYARGELLNKLYKAKNYKSFVLNKKLVKEIKDRIGNSIYYLALDESIDELYEKFMEEGFIESWFKANNKRNRKIKGK